MTAIRSRTKNRRPESHLQNALWTHSSPGGFSNEAAHEGAFQQGEIWTGGDGVTGWEGV